MNIHKLYFIPQNYTPRFQYIYDLIIYHEIGIEKFAEQSGFSKPTILNILNENTKPSFATIKIICKTLARFTEEDWEHHLEFIGRGQYQRGIKQNLPTKEYYNDNYEIKLKEKSEIEDCNG